MFKSASVSWFLIIAAVATALMAVAMGCLPEVPGGSGGDAGKVSAKPGDVRVAETPPATAASDAATAPAPPPDAAPAERAPVAVDAGTDVIDAGADRADLGAVVLDTGSENRDLARQMVDVDSEVVDASREVVDVGPAAAVEAGAGVVETGDARLDMGMVIPDAGPEIVDATVPEAAVPEAAAPDVDAACPCPVHDATPPPANRAPLPGEIVIDELLVNPAGTDIGREWIEVRSLATVPLSLAELHVADRLSDVAVAAGVLAPGEVLLLGQSLDSTKNGGAPIAVIYSTTVSLNNDGDTISLCWGACESGVVLDRYTYGALGAAYDGHALILPPSPDPARKGCPAQDPFGTAESYGTPGRPNPMCPP